MQEGEENIFTGAVPLEDTLHYCHDHCHEEWDGMVPPAGVAFEEFAQAQPEESPIESVREEEKPCLCEQKDEESAQTVQLDDSYEDEIAELTAAQ